MSQYLAVNCDSNTAIHQDGITMRALRYFIWKSYKGIEELLTYRHIVCNDDNNFHFHRDTFGEHTEKQLW